MLRLDWSIVRASTMKGSMEAFIAAVPPFSNDWRNTESDSRVPDRSAVTAPSGGIPCSAALMNGSFAFSANSRATEVDPVISLFNLINSAMAVFIRRPSRSSATFLIVRCIMRSRASAYSRWHPSDRY